MAAPENAAEKTSAINPEIMAAPRPGLSSMKQTRGARARNRALASRFALFVHLPEVGLAHFQRDVQVVIVLRLELEGHVGRFEEGKAGAVVHTVEAVQNTSRPA